MMRTRVRTPIRAAWAILAVAVVWPVAAAQAADPPEHQLDCRVYATRSGSVTIGLKAGNFLFSVGPEVTVGLQNGINWERTVQGLIARYTEACARYNVGMLTKDEYDARIRQIESFYQEAHEMEGRLVAAARDHASTASDELNKALGKPSGSAASPQKPSLDQDVQRLADRLDQQDPIGRPLTPSNPCPVPDNLGAPARSC
jgi:hypothetical protein